MGDDKRVLGKLGPGQLGPGQLGPGKLGPGQLGPGAQLSGAQLSAPKKWQIGPRTVGPRGPVVRGPTVRPEKVANWAPDSWAPKMYHLKNQKIIKKKQNTASKMQQGCSQISNMLPNIPNTQVKTVQIPNNHPKSHNHHPKYQKYHLNHQIPTPKSESSPKISNLLYTISDKQSRIQNAPPQFQMRHQKYNVTPSQTWKGHLNYKKYP